MTLPASDVKSHYLNVDDISKTFMSKSGLGEKIAEALKLSRARPAVRAVQNVTFHVAKGETLGLVGESGCGKSTVGRMLSGIYSPTEGEVTVHGLPVMEGGEKANTKVQMVFQDPFASLDPRMKIGEIIAEGPVAHALVPSNGAHKYARKWLERVGLDAAYLDRYPHQFSGGQRQRIAIARALAMQPSLLICDEPVASLDVSIQAQIINLFIELRRDLDLTSVFISHDLSVVRHVSDRVAVMYLGRIVEIAETETLFAAPAHPYTRALLNSVPQLNVDRDETAGPKPISGEIPSPLNPPPGCYFAPRCPLASEMCTQSAPSLEELEGGRKVACHRWRDMPAMEAEAVV